MTVPTNDAFASRELSIEELEMIAAGGFWSTLKHDLIKGAVYTLEFAAYAGGVAAIGLGILAGASAVATAGSNIANRFQQN
jgi:hypothetical protein